MGKPRAQGLGARISAFSRSIHPVRAAYEVCCTVLVAIPFLAAYAANHSAPIALHLLFPLLFLAVHLAWFHLSAMDSRLRWLLFWAALTVIGTFGAGLLFSAWSGASLESVHALPSWMRARLDWPFPAVSVSFIIPAAIGAALYCLVFFLFLRISLAWRSDLRQRRAARDADGQHGRDSHP